MTKVEIVNCFHPEGHGFDVDDIFHEDELSRLRNKVEEGGKSQSATLYCRKCLEKSMSEAGAVVRVKADKEGEEVVFQCLNFFCTANERFPAYHNVK